MKILLIDADSTIPNLALMKISRYFKAKFSANVDLIRLNLPYYPNKIKRVSKIDTWGYNHVFCSIIFEGNHEYVKGRNIQFGGCGFNNYIYLPKDIDDCEPDYSIYSYDFVNDTSIGFITRGCIRKCKFCKVHLIEGYICKYRNIDEIVRHKKVKFLDNNILALPEHKDILRELVSKKINCQFNQGLDIRLIDIENSELLFRLNYLGDYIFAFDDIRYLSLIETKLKLLDWRKPFQFKFFVYVHPDMALSDTVKRVIWLKQKECLPYIMRHIDCWKSEYVDFYTDLAAYCNQTFAFKKLDFQQFLDKRHKKQDRILKSLSLWNANI